MKPSYATYNVHSLHGQCSGFHCLIATLNSVIICIPLNSNGTLSQLFGRGFDRISVPWDKPKISGTVNLEKWHKWSFLLRNMKIWWTSRDKHSHYPADIYLFKISNRNTRTVWEICLKSRIRTL